MLAQHKNPHLEEKTMTLSCNKVAFVFWTKILINKTINNK